MRNFVRLCHSDRNNVNVNIKRYNVNPGVGKLLTLASRIYHSVLMKRP